MKPQQLMTYALRVLPDLDDVEQRVNDAPEALVSRGTGARERFERQRLEGAEETVSLESAAAPGEELPPVLAERRRVVVEHGKRALRKLRKEGKQATLEPNEQRGLEAIILLTSRPAILIQNGAFLDPPPEWQQLTRERARIEALLPSVGRIEVKGHPSLDWVGTGFLVAPDVVMTNRHVAKEFSRQQGRSWSYETGMKPRIDYREELGTAAPAEFALTDVIGVHEEYDLALLRVSRRSPARVKPPAALVAAADGKLKAPRDVYVVGYPAWDGHRNDPEPMRRIFSDIYNVKRLQPGQLTRLQQARGLFTHDCSTLGGNSGSCVVDLETHKVVGLHYSGRYMEANWSVLLPAIARDPLLKKAKVQFA
jgi:S1-C subfamily serine protease